MKISVISFNIRCCDDPDGHSIEERAPRLFEAVKPYDADIIGFQEVRPSPRWENRITEQYGEEYGIFNKYRTSDEKKMESSPILWKKDKFDCLETGYFWLSDTPEVESKGWDELYDCHRICEYVILKRKGSGEIFTFMNTHFGFGDNGQIASARLIYEYSRKISDYPTILVGDFNMTPKSAGYGEITKYFTDVNAVTAKSDTVTYHGYFGEKSKPSHIDFCFASGKVKPLKWEIIDKTFDGKFPSDHYGIYTELEI